MKLQRDISKLNLLFISMSAIFGSGWLFGSFYTAQIAGPASILSWFLAGLFIAIIGLTLAELSTMLPLSGGSTNYAILSHGKFCGTLFSWITWIGTVSIAPIEVQAVMQYASHYIPNILNIQTNNLTGLGFVIATFLMFILCYVNLIGVKFMSKANKYVTLWKMAIPIIIALILLTYNPHYENLTSQHFMTYGIEGIFSSISTGGVALSFFGFQTGLFLAGEAKNPKKSVPLSLFGSLLICTLIYSLLEFGFIVGVSPSSLNNGWSKLSFIGDSGPFAGLLLSLGLFFIAKLLYVDAVISPFGTGLTTVASSSRILYAISLQKDAPSFIAKLNKNHIPWVAVVVNFILGMLLFLPFSGWQQMASFLSAAIVVSMVCAPIALPLVREKLPHKPRPFIVPFYKTISFIAFYLCTLILYWTGFETIYRFDICFLIIVSAFFIRYFISNLSKTKYDFKSSLWLFVYLSLCSLLSYFGTFGSGLKIINVSESLIIVFFICLIVLKIAQKTSLNKENMEDVYHQLLVEHKENELYN